MATAVMESTRARGTGERTVEEIIDRAREAPPSAPGAFTLSVATAIALWSSFYPLNWGPLAWIALVPLIQLVRVPRRTRWMYRSIYCGGLVFSLITLQWMRLGDTWMYPAWLALAAYVALYFCAFVAIARIAVHRWRCPLSLAVPLVWVGLEFTRAHLLTGFAWYFLGHTQHQWTTLVQVSDLFGAYGVSFVVAMGNAVIAERIPLSVFSKWKLFSLNLVEADNSSSGPRPWSIAALGILLVACLVYGVVRQSQRQFRAGPRVALIQGNFPSSLKHDPALRDEIYRTHMELTGQAVPHHPDVIIWPETMFTWPLMLHDASLTDEQLAALHPMIPAEAWQDTQVELALLDLSEQTDANLIIGMESLVASEGALNRYNSAVFIEDGTGVTGRYDKLHLVPFGESIPLSGTFPALARLLPFAGPIPLSPGKNAHVFSAGGFRMMPLICFEDTVPHLVRSLAAKTGASGRDVDCFVNLTNDGWFHGSSELDQHLVTASFRCIETRTPMVRAVNTGISAFIDGDGLIREPDVFVDYDRLQSGSASVRTGMRDAETGRYHKQLNVALVSPVPLDDRNSLYVKWGDWFAALCCAICLVLIASLKFPVLVPVK